MKKIIIIEDNQDLLDAIVFSLENTKRYQVLKTFNYAEDAIREINNYSPDIILMDIMLKGKMNGIECTAIVKKKLPLIDIIILTVFEDSEKVFQALKVGACGYLTKNTSTEEIIAAIDEASSGGAPMSFKIARMVLNSFKKNLDSPLTEKEDQILAYLSKGASYKTTANELMVSVETIKFHIKNIYIKLQVNSKEEAIELARKNKWV